MNDSSENALPFVSVIVPVWNSPDMIAKCLIALSAQTYPSDRFEVLVVDNASTDSTAEVVRRFPVATLLFEPAPGSYHARNRGLKIARGEYIAFTDADCRPHENWLANGVVALTTDPSIAMVGGAIDLVIDHDGAPSLVELYEMAQAFPQKVFVEQQSYAATANMFTRRSTIDRIGPFNAALKSGGDWEFGRRVGAAGLRLVYAPEALVQHPARTSYREIVRKARRVVGGHRDWRPGWRNCIRYCLHNLLPSRGRLASILSSSRTPFGLVTKAQLVALTVSINWTYAYWRLMLQLTDAESSRN